MAQNWLVLDRQNNAEPEPHPQAAAMASAQACEHADCVAPLTV
jgi:hypothetical protein